MWDSSREYQVVLGDSFWKDKKHNENGCYHAFRYEFKPVSIDGERPGKLLRNSKDVQISFESRESKEEQITLKGVYKECNPSECVLIFHGTHFVLERLSGATTPLKVVRLDGNSSTRSHAPPPGTLDLPVDPVLHRHRQKKKRKRKGTDKTMFVGADLSEEVPQFLSEGVLQRQIELIKQNIQRQEPVQLFPQKLDEDTFGRFVDLLQEALKVNDDELPNQSNAISTSSNPRSMYDEGFIRQLSLCLGIQCRFKSFNASNIKTALRRVAAVLGHRKEEGKVSQSSKKAFATTTPLKV
mmetsp:Transcript_35356/g.45045  ORF Transcript_35356/g.45045 Transcript_35356/m.45045 type:complete len:297 (+) Transcript_35356:254-1144(+)